MDSAFLTVPGGMCKSGAFDALGRRVNGFGKKYSSSGPARSLRMALDTLFPVSRGDTMGTLIPYDKEINADAQLWLYGAVGEALTPKSNSKKEGKSATPARMAASGRTALYNRLY